MTEKKMMQSCFNICSCLSLPCMIYENESEQNTCTKLVILSSTCIPSLTQSCFPSVTPCLWIQTWEIFRNPDMFEALTIHCPSKHSVADPPRSIQRDELLRGSTNEEHLGSGPRILHGTLAHQLHLCGYIIYKYMCREGSLGSYEESAISTRRMLVVFTKWFIFSSWHLPLKPLEEESPLEMIMFKFHGFKLLEHCHPA